MPAENPFCAAVVESGTLRNTLIGAVSLLDVTRGPLTTVCLIIYRTLATLVEVARDLALRYLVVAHKYTPTLSAVHDGGERRSRRRIGTRGSFSAAFSECVGSRSVERDRRQRDRVVVEHS